MQSFARRVLVPLAVAAILAYGSGAYADTIIFSFSGPDASGIGTMQATDQGGGAYLVTSMTGTVTIDGEGGPITGLVPAGSSVGTQYYNYDNIVYPYSTPELEWLGVVFTVTGFTDPMNLCADPNCNLGSGSQAWLIDSVDGNYGFYPVEFTAQVPEAYTVVLLWFAVIAFALAMAWNRWERQRIASWFARQSANPAGRTDQVIPRAARPVPRHVTRT